MAAIYGLRAAGRWTDVRGENILDTGAHYYDVYETSDRKYVSIGSIEPKFYAELLRLGGLQNEELPRQNDRPAWPALKDRVAKIFKTKTREEWCKIMEGSEVCFAPVLNMQEAPAHPHNRQRGTFIEVDGVVQPAPAPRFSRTPSEIQRPPAVPGEHTDEALRDWGLSVAELAQLRSSGAIGARS
jgi:alpha-methylacyl-CoA racemase